MPNTPPGPPPGWGEDALSSFLQKAHENCWATFTNLAPVFTQGLTVHREFGRLVSSDFEADDIVAAALAGAAHSAFLSGFRLGTGGHVRETYSLCRNLIEYTLYAVRVGSDRDLATVWLRRSDSPEARDESRKPFILRDLIKSAQAVDPVSASNLEFLYNLTIDRGAHPNEMSLTQNSRIVEVDGKRRLFVDYLTPGDQPAFKPALAVLLISAAECCGLLVQAWWERLKIDPLHTDFSALQTILRRNLDGIRKLENQG